MSKPEYLDQLLDRAKANAGSDYALAKMIGVSRMTVSNWRHGKKPCSAPDVALLAEVAGLEPDKWLARAVVSQHEGTPKGEKLLKALGKGLLVTGAVIASSGASAAVICSTTLSDCFIRCIDLLSSRRHRGAVLCY